MTQQDDISKLALTLVEDMLALEPETPSFNIHFADSDLMGIKLLKDKILDPEENPVIGVHTARVRHKIAFNMNLPVENFSFVIDNKSDLEDLIPDQTCLVLWDYLQLSQPLAASLVHRAWKRVDLVIIVPDLAATKPGVSLRSLVTPESLAR